MPLVFSKLPGYAIESESITLDQTSNDIDEAIGSGGGPKIVSLIYPNGNTNTAIDAAETLILTGNNFSVNANVWVGNNLSSNTIVANSTYLTFVCPAINTGNYVVYVVNIDGSVGSLGSGLQINSTRIFPQGINYGYTSGGATPTISNAINKFPFASDSNATDVGDLTQARAQLSGQSSYTHGYSSGGFVPFPPGNAQKTIDKFSFSSDGNATTAGALFSFYAYTAGQSSTTHGYVSGGIKYPVGSTPISPTVWNGIEKFPFAIETGSIVDVGDLTQARSFVVGQNSIDNGYTSGGTVPPNADTIDKFPFASDANATDVGNLTQARVSAAGQSSSISGYTSGGGFTTTDIIDKFPFASNANATDVGDLSQPRYYCTGQSSVPSGYTSGGGGAPTPPTTVNTIDKFPFATDTNATDVGDLTGIRMQTAGQQY